MGAGSAKDNVAYIARINAGDLKPIDVFIQSGRNNVTLNAPKGTALQGDTLWVADIDVVRGFNRRSGAPTRTIDLSALSPQLLNDIDIAADGTMYVTDTGIAMTDKGVLHPGGDKVIRIDRNGVATVIANAAQLPWPNGVRWDAAHNRLLVVSFDPFRSTVYALNSGGGSPSAVAHGKGRYDGVEILPDGSLLVSCWNDQSVRIIGKDGVERGLIGNVFTPADIGVDTRRSRIAIPLASRGRVEFWDYGHLAPSVALR
jgi:sugar lactone lactonase YvrE